MSLAEPRRKIKDFFGISEDHIVLVCHVLIVIFVGAGSYLLGAISHEEGKGSISFERVPRSEGNLASIFQANRKEAQEPLSAVTQRSFVASRQGTKYHRMDCSGAKTIKVENKVYFSTESDAKKAGYLPAGNCPGLGN